MEDEAKVAGADVEEGAGAGVEEGAGAGVKAAAEAAEVTPASNLGTRGEAATETDDAGCLVEVARGRTELDSGKGRQNYTQNQ